MNYYTNVLKIPTLSRYVNILHRVLVDNNCTVTFAIFISLWAVFFVKFWGRYCAKLTHRFASLFKLDTLTENNAFGKIKQNEMAWPH